MDWKAFVRTRLARITGDAARDDEIVEELAQHLATRYDELCSGGATGEQALERVERELQDSAALARAIRRADRQRPASPIPPPTDGTQLLGDLWRDLRYTVRLLRRNPGFTAAALLTLALGIGMTAAIFSVVQAVLLRPVPFPEPDRLLMVWQTDRDAGTTREPAAIPDFADFRERSRTIDALGAFSAYDMNLAPGDGDPIRISAVGATPDTLRLLGVQPVAGRLYTAGEDAPGGPPVVLISESLWQNLFARQHSAIGSMLRLNGRARTIVGVVPASADFGMLQILSSAAYARGFADRDARTRVDVWTPMQLNVRAATRDSHGLLMVGRLAPGASVASAQDELTRIAADLERAYPSNLARGAFVEPLQQVVFGRVETALAVLMAAVSLVLLISCVNVANLLLARGASRMREVAVRSALGAEAPRLVRQFAVESLVLSLVAAALGVAFAYGTLQVLVVLAPANIPRLASAAIDARVLLLTLAVSTIVGGVFAFFPMSQVRGAARRPVLGADDASRGAVAGQGRLRSALVVVEVAMAVVLVMGAGLLIRSFWQISRTDPGFQVAGVLKAEFQLPPTRYPTGREAAPGFTAFNRVVVEMLDTIRRLQGVESVALGGHHPLDTGFTSSFRVVGREAEGANWPELSLRHVTPGYFSTLRVPLVGGRLLNDSDTSTSAPVVVINQAVADGYFPGQDPVGHKIEFWGTEWTVVGVVGNERFQGIVNAPPIAAYAPLVQTRLTTLALIVRTSGDAAAMASPIRSAIRTFDPGLAVFGVQPLAETLSNSLAEQRFMMLLLGLFAALAVTLAAIGVHGVLAYIVAQRTREIGVRMALGADAGRVVRLVIAQGAALTGLGLAGGVLLAIAASRWLATLLFEVQTTDAVTLAGVVALLAGVAVVSIWLPARRAVRVDPLAALRQE